MKAIQTNSKNKIREMIKMKRRTWIYALMVTAAMGATVAGATERNVPAIDNFAKGGEAVIRADQDVWNRNKTPMADQDVWSRDGNKAQLADQDVWNRNKTPLADQDVWNRTVQLADQDVWSRDGNKAQLADQDVWSRTVQLADQDVWSRSQAK